MTTFDPQRRKVLLAAGTAATAAIAGCLGDDDDDNGRDPVEPVGTVDEVPDEVDSYMTEQNAEGYDGTLTDFRGVDGDIVVEVGPGAAFRYDPAAIIIDAGTTVYWEWESDGHSATSADDLFDSGIENEGNEFDYSFGDAGNYMYYCVPHQGSGHHGAVVVE